MNAIILDQQTRPVATVQLIGARPNRQPRSIVTLQTMGGCDNMAPRHNRTATIVLPVARIQYGNVDGRLYLEGYLVRIRTLRRCTADDPVLGVVDISIVASDVTWSRRDGGGGLRARQQQPVVKQHVVQQCL